MFVSLGCSVIMQVLAIYMLMTLDTNKMSMMWFVGLGLFVYGAFLILDLRSISKKLPPDEYIIGAFTLYIDLMTFFVYILALCGKKK